MGRTDPAGFARALSLERSLARVRWFGIALGAGLTLAYSPNPGIRMPSTAPIIVAAGLGVLLAANIALIPLLRRATVQGLRRIGAGMFLADLAGVWTIVWAYSFDPVDNSWVVLTVLAVEGALRYELRGALSVAAIAIPIEVARGVVIAMTAQSPEPLSVAYIGTGIGYRVGIVVMIAAIAGGMAQNLGRARAEAEELARQHQEVAMLETAARRESNAFRRVILAGVSAEHLDEALDEMLHAIAVELGYERLAVLLRSPDDTLRPVAMLGFAEDVRDAMIRVGEGIAGQVVRAGASRIVPDVHADPDYFPVDQRTRSQITLPIRLGAEVIGALDVESSEPDAFDEHDRQRLERLTAQMGLVIHNARLLQAERATVERLQELDQLKSDFIAIASHELRTPLTAMQGSIKTLLRPGIDDQTATDLLAILDRRTDRLTRLVEDLLMTSNVTSGHLRLDLAPADLRAVIATALDDLGGAAERVSLAVSDSLPTVVTDASRVAQIVRNLVENALKFSPPDAPVRVTAQVSSVGFIIDVSDEGPGVPPEEVANIFDRFHQVGGSMGRRSEGLGLGLFITKRLVEALGGTIEIVQSAGPGATFRVRLPMAADEATGETA